MRSRIIRLTVMLISVSLASGYLYISSRNKKEGGNQNSNSNTTDGSTKVDPRVLMSSSKSKIVGGDVFEVLSDDSKKDSANDGTREKNIQSSDNTVEPEEPVEGKPEPKPSQQLAPSSKSAGMLLSKELLDELLEDSKKKKSAKKSGDAPEP